MCHLAPPPIDTGTIEEGGEDTDTIEEGDEVEEEDASLPGH